ncbi:hypothetical protein GCM10009098_35590 [Rheinheimera aquimaris]|uniref:Endonuclease/exonuclease/phosphatase domain-containing protein n=1 Tax=Rheinheimera aquimaris TaxID=412437 RepID=A0ABN1EDF8_9GAMM|nr:endonuclease/exonuclease/phosphatase family protein [Rheinheimera aquimaris]MCB5215232.1 endonuclease/exonuclease/phosphatase family protein [Rheinheimera aquimaris]
MPNSSWRAWRSARIVALVFALLLSLVSYWPKWQWLQWLSLLVLYSPSWLFLGLFVPWLLGWKSLTRWQCLMLVPMLFVAAKILDVSWPVSRSAQDTNFVLLSANLGNMANTEQLAQLMTQHKVSVAIFQEARLEKLTALDADNWQTHCDAGLCIVSKFPFDVEQTLSRSLFQGYGNFAVFYRLNLPERHLLLANVHFETPRPALESLIKLSPDNTAMQVRQQDRELQATIIADWAHSQEEALVIGGDFNMPVLSPIYQHYFSSLGNALSERPTQIVRYTKYTRWHGIRIDHQLYRGDLMPLEAGVLQLSSGDHRPVLVKWRI